MSDILIGSDNEISVLGVVNADTGAAITTAVVTARLYDNDLGTDLSGLVTLTHDAGGDYYSYFSASLALTPCMQCRVEININAGAGLMKNVTQYYEAKHGTLDAQIFLDNSDNTLTVNELEKRPDTAVYFDAGDTVEVTLTDIYGVDIAGQVWPTAMTYEAASNGKFECNLADTLDIDAGDVVKVLLTADGGTGLYREWRFILTVQTGA